MFTPFPSTATTSGVRVSCSPRRTPVVASITSSGVVPSHAMRRYVVAKPSTDDPGAERPHQRPGERDAEDGDDDPDQHRQPDPVDALCQGALLVAGADVPRDAGRGAVRQEDAQPHRGLQHHRRDALPGQLRRPEVAHDRGVREQEQRLGHQRQERRHREPQDLPVVSVRHGHTLAPRNDQIAVVIMTSSIHRTAHSHDPGNAQPRRGGCGA